MDQGERRKKRRSRGAETKAQVTSSCFLDLLPSTTLRNLQYWLNMMVVVQVNHKYEYDGAG